MRGQDPLELKVIPHPVFSPSSSLQAARLTKFSNFLYPDLSLWLSEVPGQGDLLCEPKFGVWCPYPPPASILTASAQAEAREGPDAQLGFSQAVRP